MKNAHEACDQLFLMCLNHGLKFMIESGIEGGSLKDEIEGINIVKDVIKHYEQLEHYEKCEILLKMILIYYDIKRAA
jgi:hypothetical protein